jgi:hypothetical protein
MSVASSNKSDRRGSFMSDRQLARAAVDGKKITFKIIASEYSYEVMGYVVGMDDYHWLVAVPVAEGARLTLVHKGSADVINIPRDPHLNDEKPHVQEDVRAVGTDFWSFCRRNYLGQSES